MRFICKRLRVWYGLCVPLLLLALLGGASAAAFADSGTHAKAVVKGGSLALHGFTSGTKSITVASSAQGQTSTYTLALSVVDARGSGAGWSLTITSTQFSTGGSAPHTLPAGASSMKAPPKVACAPRTTCTLPLNGVSYVQPLVVPAGAAAPSPVRFFSAAAKTGLGSFTITPTISVLIPANTYGGVYRSSVSVTIASGP